jgi:hypothetical protein
MSSPGMPHSRPRVSGFSFIVTKSRLQFREHADGASVVDECVIHPGGTASSVPHRS